MDKIKIRTVNVELLRAGPPHNQLLSPLTQYLGLCGDSGAGIVTLPYEHRAFIRRLRYLRYDEEQLKDRLAVLRDTGADMARILSAIPGLPGALSSDPDQPEVFIHLRLVLSASELALLPFELSKVPVGPGSSSENWLALQTRVPVCITRHIRTVPSEGVRWSTEPRILFVGGAGDIPFEAHRRGLAKVIEPFRYPKPDDLTGTGGGDEQYGGRLTVLEQATFAEIEEECARGQYTHVHILAHGAEDPSAEGQSFGLAFSDDDGEIDVVSGERFASALTSLACGRIHRPDVVTVASCDGGNVGSVEAPGGSFAHELHRAGIPLVVASQFPLSKEGSIAITSRLYPGLLWGESPWILLHNLRSHLHARMTTHSHDWASLVVYEALPSDLDEQINKVRYAQTRRAINAALEGVDQVVQKLGSEVFSTSLEKRRLACIGRLEQARKRLPMSGPFGIECLGLRASSYKRQAQAEFALAARAADEDASIGYLESSVELLEKAYLDYQQASHDAMVDRGMPIHRSSCLHWVLVQKLSLATVFGKKFESDAWVTARLSAEKHLQHPVKKERAWAHGSLAELWLLKLADSALKGPERYDCRKRAQEHAAEIIELFPGRKNFTVFSTLRQFKRYVDWWGSPLFRRAPEDAMASLSSGEPSIVETAWELVRTLDQRTWYQVRHVLDAGDWPAAETAADDAPQDAATGIKPGERLAGGRTEAAQAPDVADEPEPAIVAASKDAPAFDLEMLPAGHGDALWLEYGDRKKPSRVLIDCGMKSTYELLRSRVRALPPKERAFELFVLTHIDADHIGGAIPFFNDTKLDIRFGDVWFNGWKHLPQERLGAVEAEVFSTLIEIRKLPWNFWSDGGPVQVERDLPVCELPGGMKLTLLSPTPKKLARLSSVWEKTLKKHGLMPGAKVDLSEYLRGPRSTSTDVDELLEGAKFGRDSSAPNGSSIGFLAEYEGKSALLIGDAHASVIAASIAKLLKQRQEDKLAVDVLKVSHHASRNNLSPRLLQLLDCKRYLISTDGSRFHHPDRETVALLIRDGGDRPELCFNYRSEDNQLWDRPDLKDRYSYIARYPEAGQEGFKLTL